MHGALPPRRLRAAVGERPARSWSRRTVDAGEVRIRVIEFLGIPGSGKTTLWRRACRHLADRHVVAYEPVEATRVAMGRGSHDLLTRALALSVGRVSPKLWKKIYIRSSDRIPAVADAIAHHPEQFAAFVAAARSHNHDAGPEVVASAMLDLLVIRELVETRLRDDEWLLVDEGFCNRVVSLFAVGWERKADRPVLKAYVDAIPKPDLVVHVSTPIEVCAQRLDERGWTRRVRHKPRAELMDFLANANECVDIAASMLARRGVRVVLIGGEDALEAAAAELTTELDRLVAPIG